MEYIADLAQIIVTPTIVVIAAYLVLNRMLKREADARNETQRAGLSQTVLPLRLQAYERIVILMERISPQQMLIRLNHPGMSAGQMQWQMLKTIREEFEHNISQQLYVSHELWGKVSAAREELTKLINISMSGINPEDNSAAFAGKMLELFSSQQENPITEAIRQAREEAHRLF